MAKATTPKTNPMRQHPLVGCTLRAYGAEDTSLRGPHGTVLAVFPTACPEVGNVAMVQLYGSGTILLPLAKLASKSETWTWVL